MIKLDDVKKWEYEKIFDNTESIFKDFNEIYSKNREAARYFVIGKELSSTRIVSFIKKHVHIIVHEQISYGVSITLKRYKSTKTIEKYYVDTKNGSISKSIRGKFIPAKISDISSSIRKYIISKIKWIDFVFKSELPITFNTVVKHKLYSKRKLLSWFWGTNYEIALKINKYTNYGSNLFIFRNNKNIKNINNINKNFFENHEHHTEFMTVLYLSIICRKNMNAAWSFKRLKNESKKLNRIILDTLYNNFDFDLKIVDKFLPIIGYLKNIGYQIPKTAKELSVIINNKTHFDNCLDNNKTNNNIIIKRNGVVLLLADSTYGFISDNDDEFCVSSTYSNIGNKDFVQIKSEITNDIKILNKKYDSLVKMYHRKNKMLKLTKKIEQGEYVESL